MNAPGLAAMDRRAPVKPFELIRWARSCAHVLGPDGRPALKPLEAHVLLVLTTYANDECLAWPSIRLIAADCGRRSTNDGHNSSVSAALNALEVEHVLLATKQSGRGRPAIRELLFTEQPSAMQEGSESLPSGMQDAQPSGMQDQKYQENTQTEHPDRSLPSRRKASPPMSKAAQREARRKRNGEALQTLIRAGGLEAFGTDSTCVEATCVEETAG
jgi:hypothetical protein